MSTREIIDFVDKQLRGALEPLEPNIPSTEAIANSLARILSSIGSPASCTVEKDKTDPNLFHMSYQPHFPANYINVTMTLGPNYDTTEFDHIAESWIERRDTNG